MTRPTPVYAGGLSQRAYAIQQAQTWMREVAKANTPAPSREYLIVRDVLAALLAQDRSSRKRSD